MYKKRVWLFPILQKEIIISIYKLKLENYISIIRTLKWIKLYYGFLKIKKVISKVISLYDIYNKTKVLKYKFYKFLKLLFVLLKV